MFIGWQYLGLSPSVVMKMTPREFSLILEAEKERKYDYNEINAHQALMARVANNKEHVKMTDIYERPQDSFISQLRGDVFEKEVESVKKAQDFIENLKFN